MILEDFCNLLDENGLPLRDLMRAVAQIAGEHARAIGHWDEDVREFVQFEVASFISAGRRPIILTHMAG